MIFKLNSPGESALRRGRCSIPGQPYFLTFTAYQRIPWFADWENGCAMSALLSDPARWQGGQLLAWVLMPDHWHGLLVLSGETGLHKVLQRAKGSSAREFNLRLRRTGSVWSPGFHDRGLRNHENLRAAARYLVANPLRAGLVERVGDYPFWDAVWVRDDCPV